MSRYDKEMNVAKKKSGPKKADPNAKKGTRLEDFLDDWGRLVIPVGTAAILALLRFVGILNDISLGYVIGLLMLLSTMAAFGLMIYRNPFPDWVRWGTIAAGVLFLIGAFTPFTTEIYPGTPVKQISVSKSEESIVIEGLKGGNYRVDVLAKSFAEAGAARTGQGQYRIKVGGKELTGSVSDTVRATRGRKGMAGQVEDRHFQNTHHLRLSGGDVEVVPERIDAIIGPDLVLSIYKVWLSPYLAAGLLVLVGLWGMFLDGVFQDLTWRWRLSPWWGVGALFVWTFMANYDPSNMPAAAIWSAVFGGLGGFLIGWLCSLLARKFLGKLRNKF